MSGQIFRKNSLDKISSAEQINDYIKTSGIGAWTILSAILILIIGAAVWGFTGYVEITHATVTVCREGQSLCYISEEDIQLVTSDTTFAIDGQTFTAHNISALPVLASEVISPYAMHVAHFEQGEWVYEVQFNSSLPDGIYETQMVIERVSPISLLLN